MYGSFAPLARGKRPLGLATINGHLSLCSFTSTLASNDPLQTLFQFMSGRIPQAATVLLQYPSILGH